MNFSLLNLYFKTTINILLTTFEFFQFLSQYLSLNSTIIICFDIINYIELYELLSLEVNNDSNL